MDIWLSWRYMSLIWSRFVVAHSSIRWLFPASRIERISFRKYAVDARPHQLCWLQGVIECTWLLWRTPKQLEKDSRPRIGGYLQVNLFDYVCWEKNKKLLSSFLVPFLECGGHFAYSSGVITSPNYPLNYDDQSYCEWLLEAEPSHSMTLRFTDFDMPTDCSKGSVKVSYFLCTIISQFLTYICIRYIPDQRKMKTICYLTFVVVKLPRVLASRRPSNRKRIKCWWCWKQIPLIRPKDFQLISIRYSCLTIKEYRIDTHSSNILR